MLWLVTDLETCEQLAHETITRTRMRVPIDAFRLARLLGCRVSFVDVLGSVPGGDSRHFFVSRRLTRREQHVSVAEQIAGLLLFLGNQPAAPESISQIACALLLPRAAVIEAIGRRASLGSIIALHANVPDWMVEARVRSLTPSPLHDVSSGV